MKATRSMTGARGSSLPHCRQRQRQKGRILHRTDRNTSRCWFWIHHLHMRRSSTLAPGWKCTGRLSGCSRGCCHTQLRTETDCNNPSRTSTHRRALCTQQRIHLLRRSCIPGNSPRLSRSAPNRCNRLRRTTRSRARLRSRCPMSRRSKAALFYWSIPQPFPRCRCTCPLAAIQRITTVARCYVHRPNDRTTSWISG